jgi:hypothetical protein
MKTIKISDLANENLSTLSAIRKNRDAIIKTKQDIIAQLIEEELEKENNSTFIDLGE